MKYAICILFALCSLAQAQYMPRTSGGSGTQPADWDTATEINTATTDDDFVTLSGTQTINGLKTFSAASAASTPAGFLTGTWFTGGTGTTTFPHLFLRATGTTAATTWSTAGTAFGINAVTGFTGNFIDFKLAGASASAFKVTSAGAGTFGSTLAILTLTATQGGGGAITVAGAGGGVQVGSTGYLGFSSSGSGAGTIDTKLSRNAAEVLEINNGTLGMHRDLILRKVTVGGTGGTAVTLIGSAAATLDFPSTMTQTSSDLPITLNGAVDGDGVIVSPPNGSANANSAFTARISAADTVTVTFHNYQAVTAINPASGTFRVSIMRF